MSGALSQNRYSLRVTGGVIAICGICIFGTLQYSSAESAYQHQTHDSYMIGAQTMRFARFAAVVPRDATLGYFTDAPPGSTADSVLFTSATYALAPRLLERNLAHEYVLGNFTRPADFAAMGRSNGLRLQRDFGSGVVLYHQDSRP